MAGALETLVHTALNVGCENGYEDECLTHSLENVAINLIDYDADIGELHPDVMDVMPHVESWRKKRAH